jgi:hypothetical protein
MLETNSVVAIYQTHSEAEEAVKELQRSGFDIKKCPSSARIITPTSTSLGTITPAIV